MGQQNNIGIIRLLLALLVVWSHSYPLARGLPVVEPIVRFLYQESAGSIAVNSFFLLSGYLITRSWLTSASMADYVRRRVLRIYPGFLVAVALSLVVAAAFAAGGPLDYLRALWQHNDAVLRGVLFLDGSWLDAGATFVHNPLPGAVNGSLWTLQPELACYGLVAVAGVLGGLSPRRVLLLCGAAYGGYALNLFTCDWSPHQYARAVYAEQTLWRFLTYFTVGAVFYCYRDRIRLGSLPLMAASVALLALGSRATPWLALLLPLLGGYVLFSLAFAPVVLLARFTARTDLSYGVYIYAFPVQQVCVYYLKSCNPWLLFGLSTPITLAVAWVSWVAVERPCLRGRRDSPAASSPP
ncbi:MAG TPA: acyltransferase [Gemmataceae bacterium]|nr:acyltransferase [Gemmataceae bacterium]